MGAKVNGEKRFPRSGREILCHRPHRDQRFTEVAAGMRKFGGALEFGYRDGNLLLTRYVIIDVGGEPAERDQRDDENAQAD